MNEELLAYLIIFAPVIGGIILAVMLLIIPQKDPLTGEYW